MLSLVILRKLGLSPVYSVAISFWLGLAVAFTAQKLITFNNRHTGRTLHIQGAGYIALVAWNYFFTLTCTSLGRRYFNVFITRTFAILVTTLWNYQIYKHLFKNKNLSHDQAA